MRIKVNSYVQEIHRIGMRENGKCCTANRKHAASKIRKVIGMTSRRQHQFGGELDKII